MARGKTIAKAKGRGLVWVQGLACGACVAVAPIPCATIAVLLAPAIVMLVRDRSPGRPVGRAMLLCGSAACVSPIATLSQMGSDSGFALLSDPGVFGPAWAACAGGWLLTQILPIAMRGVMESASLARAARLRAERARLLTAWDFELRQ